MLTFDHLAGSGPVRMKILRTFSEEQHSGFRRIIKFLGILESLVIFQQLTSTAGLKFPNDILPLPAGCGFPSIMTTLRILREFETKTSNGEIYSGGRIDESQVQERVD